MAGRIRVNGRAVVRWPPSVFAVGSLAEMAALPFDPAYELVIAPDGDGVLGMFEWDATVEAADAVANSVVALDGGLGGFRRKGVL